LSLLHQIQESVVQEGADIGSVLLKLRLLASRLGSDLLEEWVKHESEGYPKGTEVPSYRKVGVSYHGTFSGPFGSGIKNAPIPSYLINMQVNACNDIRASISRTSFAEIQQAVRSKILELTLELEKAIPAAVQVTFGAPGKQEANPDKVQQISQQIIYGNVSTAVAGGHGSNITLTIGERDTVALIEYLVKSGFPMTDATQIAEIMETEEPTSVEEPFGEKAKGWLSSNLKKAAQGTWNIGISVATNVLSEAALKYYGLK
jgi:hypothetical protein